MNRVKTALAIALAILSAYMVLRGLVVFISTTGVVESTEFSVLITLANQISLFMIWLSLFSFWRLIPSPPGGRER